MACTTQAAAIRDEFKEESRKYRRTVFDFAAWAKHRSSQRYARHLKDILASRIVRGLAQPLLAIIGVALATATYETLREDGILGAFPKLPVEDAKAFNLTSFALSLLLVFRTNSSYSRWDEARKIWGGMLNRSRDIVRQGLSWFGEDRGEDAAMLARWQVAFMLATMAHLREDVNLEQDLQDVLPEEERKALLASKHRPNAALMVMSQVIASVNLSDIKVSRMDENLTFFADSVGACERIFKTPIPLSYTRHTSRFLSIWLLFLPLSLWPTARWSTVPASAVIAFLLLGIEEIGVQIEEPFSILPLEAICGTSKLNIIEMCEKSDMYIDMLNSHLPKRSALPAAQERQAVLAGGNGVEQK